MADDFLIDIWSIIYVLVVTTIIKNEGEGVDRFQFRFVV